MKKTASLIIGILLISALLIPAFASGKKITLDGKNNNNEWYSFAQGSESNLVGENPGLNCNIQSGNVQYRFDTDNNIVYLFFGVTYKATENGKIENTGIELSVNGCEAVRLSCEGSDKTVNEKTSSGEYTFDAYLYHSKNKGEFSCEVAVYCNKGIDKSLTLSVIFYDDTGVGSTMKSASFQNPDFMTSAVTDNNSSRKTTKSKTTETKRETHSVSTSPETSYSSRVTTRAAKTTEKDKEKTTRVSTANNTSKKSDNGTYKSNSAVSSSADDSSSSDSLLNESGISQSAKYKILIGIGAAVLFGIMGVWAIRTRAEASKAEKAEKKEKEEKQNKSDKDKNPNGE